MSETPDESIAGHDSRDGGQGPSDIPEESASSESDLALSKQAAERDTGDRKDS